MDKDKLSGHASPAVFILKATRINLIHIFNDSAFLVIVREEKIFLHFPLLTPLLPLAVLSRTSPSKSRSPHLCG